MQIELEAAPLGPLRVLSHLPSARLAVLEGLNGIGKTLTVRLLQICTGVVPYKVESPAWQSLCRGLGVFTLRVSGLRGAGVIEWTADSREWENASAASLPFHRISIDGKNSTIVEVRSLLVVHRVAGDETLLETLAQQADTAESVLQRWGSVLRDKASPVNRLTRIGLDVSDIINDLSSVNYTSQVDQVRRAEAAAKKASELAAAAAQRLQTLSNVAELLEKLDGVRNLAPDIQHRLQVVDRKISQTQKELDSAQSKMLQLAKQAARTESVLKELTNAQKTYRRNQLSLTSANNLAAAIAGELGVEPTRPVVNIEVYRLQQIIQTLTSQQNSSDAAPAMIRLLNAVSTYLSDGEARGLASQVALDDPETALQLTVTQTRVGIGNRRTQLQNQAPSPEAQEVRDRLTLAKERLARLTELSNRIIEVERYRRLARTNAARVDKALAAADPTAITELRRLEQHRRERDDVLLELAAERASLRHQLGNLGVESPEVLEARINAEVQQFNITAHAVPEELELARKAEQDARLELSQHNEHLESLRRDLVRMEADVRRVARIFADGGDYSWLAASVADFGAETESVPVQQLLTSLDRLRTGVEGAMDRIGGHLGQIGAVERAARGVARILRGQGPEATEYVPELEAYFGAKFSEWFNSDKVRGELLRDADGKIIVDVGKKEVQWTEQGHIKSRPLEAFSSGEQAFAYTRARLAVLDEELREAPNRLIVLDEFGAFIAHDRLSVLLSYLQTRVTEHPEDQVLVILPLSRDYAREAQNSIGARREELQKIADQIVTQRFGVRVLAA